MTKAIIRPDGWVVCGKHIRKKLFRVIGDNIVIPCGECRSNVMVSLQDIYDLWECEDMATEEMWDKIKGE